MTPKIFQIFVLLTIISVSTQRKPASESEHKKLLHGKGFQNLKKHLAVHDSPKHQHHKKEDNPNLLNIQTLNLYFKPQLVDAQARIDSQDRSCGSGRCQYQRHINDDDMTKNEVQQLLDELENELDRFDPHSPLRCSDDRCGKELRDNDDRCGCPSRTEDKSDDSDDDELGLRCKGNRCSKRPERSDDKLKSELERYGKKYKINDNLDAIVLDFSKLDGVLGKADNDDRLDILHQSEYVKYPNDIKNIALDYLDYNDRFDKEYSDPVKAIVVNLGQLKNNAEVLEQVKDALSLAAKEDQAIRPNELADYYEFKKQQILNNAINFVKNNRGDKNILYLSNAQKNKLLKLRAQVQLLGSHLDSNEINTKVKDIVLGKVVKSEVLPHEEDTNNVYIPKWLHKAVKKSRDDLRSKKRIFPMTQKQKLKTKTMKPVVWRRHLQKSMQDYGVPFELQIQGLGQVNT